MNNHIALCVDFVRRLRAFATLRGYLGADIDTAISHLISSMVSEASVEAPNSHKLSLPRHLSDSESIQAGLRAIKKGQHAGRAATLSPSETSALELIILLTGRPALFIQGGHLQGIAPGWEILEQQRTPIQQHIPSIGRIEIRTTPHTRWVEIRTPPYIQWRAIATGFLVAEAVVMTNRHVVEAFCSPGPDGNWYLTPGYEARINFCGEIDRSDTHIFALQAPARVHPIYDLALLHAEHVSNTGATLPRPLSLASQAHEPLAERMVYTVGYPIQTGSPAERRHAQRVFAGQFGFKRLLPGRIGQYFSETQQFTHNCTTLAGSSGSPVIDLDTHRVLGLHVSGAYLTANYALALWTLRNDPLFIKMGIYF